MSQSNLGKVTVNFVSREIVHMIEFLRMIFVLKKSSCSCFKYRYKPVSKRFVM